MNEFVTLYSIASVKSQSGAVTTSYSEGATVHAEVDWRTGATSDNEPENFASERVEVIIRYAIPVEREWRLRYRNEMFHIDAVECNRPKGFKRLICNRVNE